MFTDILECNIKGIHLPMRWIVCLIICGTVMVCDIERHLLSAIMTIVSGKPVINTTLCPISDGDNLSPPKINLTLLDFTFSPARTKWLQNTFYISYIIFHVPCGIIVDHIGPRAIVGLGVAVSMVASIVIPIYYWSTPISIVVSVIMGAGQASLYPGINAFCVTWAPYFQRGIIVGLVFSSYVFIKVTHFANVLENISGWHFGFYIWGIVTLIWYVIFHMYSYSDPQRHPFMPKPEKDYLKLKAVQTKRALKIPWAAIVTDRAVWAIITAEVAFFINSYAWRTEAKKYFWKSFAYDIENSAFFYVLPHILLVFITLITGIINDFLLRSGKLSAKSARKVFTTIGIGVPAVLMIIFAQVGCHKHLAQWLFFVALALEGAVCGGGHLQNILDVSVNFPGVVMAIINALSTGVSLTIPHLLIFLEKTQAKEEWKLAFYLSFAMTIILTALSVLNVSGTRAKWDFSSDDERETWPNLLREMKSGERTQRAKERRPEDDDDLSD